MYSIVSTAIIHGIQSVPISVEADVSDGLPVFEMVGFLCFGSAGSQRESAYSIEKLWLCPASKAYYDQFYACEYQKIRFRVLTFRLRWQSLPHSGISDRKWSGNIL